MVPLLQSSGHLCFACSLPQRLSLCFSCTTCTFPGSVSVFASTLSTLFIHLTLALLDMLTCCVFNQRFSDQMTLLFSAGVNALSSGPWILVEDLSSVYNDVEVERGAVKHAHKKRKLADGREKTMVRTD